MKRLLAASALVLLVLAVVALQRDADDAGGPAAPALAGTAPEVASLPVAPASVPDAQPLVPRETPATAPQTTSAPPAVSRTLQRPTSWTIVAVDAGEEPVPGARVEVWEREEALAAGAPAAATHWTDALGRVTVVLPSWGAALLASHPQVGTSGIWDMDTLSGDGALTAQRESVVSLLPLARVEGVVHRAGGAPAAAASVHRWALRFGEDGRRARPAPPLAVDADGRFALELDALAPLLLHAELGEERTPPVPLELEPGSQQQVELFFPGAWALHGQVVDALGAPVPGALLTLWQSAATVDERTADEAGAFSFDLERGGSFELLATCAGHAPSDLQAVELLPDAPRQDVLLRLPPPAELEGTLLLDGAPVAGARVYAQPTEGQAPRCWERFGTASATSDEHGRFALAPLRADGLYDVIAYPWPDEPAASVRRSSLTTGGGGALIAAESAERRRVVQLVEVVAAEEERPVGDVELAVARRGEGGFGGQRAAHDALGRYRLEDLVPGAEYALLVEAGGFGPARAGWFVARAEAPALRIALQRSAEAEVEIVDAVGSPAAFAVCRVELTDAVADLPPAWSAFRFEVPLRADAAGRVRLAPIDAGRYRLHVEHGAAPVHSVEVLIPGGTTTRVRVELPR